jgi:uncharacterized membrane protein
MANVLRLGLVIALALLAAAEVALLVRSPSTTSGQWISSNPLVRYLDPRALGSGLVRGEVEAYLTLGVYALIATPVVRVLTAIDAFARHGERRMAVLATVVLVLLLVGLLIVGPVVR